MDDFAPWCFPEPGRNTEFLELRGYPDPDRHSGHVPYPPGAVADTDQVVERAAADRERSLVDAGLGVVHLVDHRPALVFPANGAELVERTARPELEGAANVVRFVRQFKTPGLERLQHRERERSGLHTIALVRQLTDAQVCVMLAAESSQQIALHDAPVGVGAQAGHYS